MSAVEIFNKSASECSVAISRENRKRNFITGACAARGLCSDPAPRVVPVNSCPLRHVG